MLLEMAAEAAPDRVAVGSRDGGLTYAALLARARSLAGDLQRRGAERLGLVDVNSDAVPVCLFGAAIAGIPFAPINYRFTEPQLAAVLARLAPATVVAGRDVEARLQGVDGIDV